VSRSTADRIGWLDSGAVSRWRQDGSTIRAHHPDQLPRITEAMKLFRPGVGKGWCRARRAMWRAPAAQTLRFSKSGSPKIEHSIAPIGLGRAFRAKARTF